MKFFDNPKFLKHWRDANEFFQHYETKKLRRKIVTPLLCMTFFDTRTFLRHWRDAHEIFRHCETENFWRKGVIPPITYYAKSFRIPEIFWNIAGVNTKIFVTVRPKFSTEICYRRPPPFIFKNFAAPDIFSTTVGYLYKFFRHCETNNFGRKIVTPLWCIKLFDYPKLSKTLKGCLSSFRHCQTWNFSTEKFDTRHFIRKNFSKPEIFSKTVGFLYKKFRHCETKIFRWKVVTPPLCLKFFDYPEPSDTLKGYLRFFRQCHT